MDASLWEPMLGYHPCDIGFNQARDPGGDNVRGV